ncbi:MAG: Imm74 family immunity protein [Mobilitalea sp.]
MILGGTNSYVRVELNGKIVKIEGELLANGFLAYKNTIRKWESPHENEVIDQATKDLIIQHVLEESQKANFKIEFE